MPIVLGIRILWLLAVSLIAYIYPPVGALFAITTAAYWLLAPYSPQRLLCVTGNHYIGNEPYSFLSNGDAQCARCHGQLDERVGQTFTE